MKPKPCPLCGCKNTKVEEIYSHIGWHWVVACGREVRCGLILESRTATETREQIVKRWSTRQITSHLVQGA